MIPRHLVRLSPTLFTTHGYWYGKNSHYVRKIHERLVKDVKKVEDALKLKDHKFVLRPIPGEPLGLTYPTLNLAYIEPRRHSYREVLSTVLHEGMHLKQVQDGRLEWSRAKWSILWDGEPHDDGAPVRLTEKAVKQYRALPWEEDVLKRHDNLYRKIFNKEPPKLRNKIR